MNTASSFVCPLSFATLNSSTTDHRPRILHFPFLCRQQRARRVGEDELSSLSVALSRLTSIHNPIQHFSCIAHSDKYTHKYNSQLHTLDCKMSGTKLSEVDEETLLSGAEG
jgi:hypothetical protein